MASRQNRLSHPAIGKIVLAGYVLVLLIATHLPPTVSLLLPEEHNLDKLYHFTAYAILAGFLATAWQLASGVLTARHLRWVWIAVAIFAALDEITQIPVGRDCDFWDWTADVIGAAVGLLVFAWLRRRITARTTQAR
jgi:VanZ family protein